MTDPSTELAQQLEALESAKTPREPYSIPLGSPIDSEAGPSTVSELELRPLTWASIAALPLPLSDLTVDHMLELAVGASDLTATQAGELDLADLHKVMEGLSSNLATLVRAMRQDPGSLPPIGNAPQLVPLTTPGLPGPQAGAPLESLTMSKVVAGHVRGIGLNLAEMTWGELRQVAGRSAGQPDAIMRRLELDDVAAVTGYLLPFLLRLQGI